MTLAQAYINHHQRIRYQDDEVNWTDYFIMRRLLMPLPGNEGMTAERFVFDEDAPRRLDDWCDAGMVDWNTAIRSIQQPDIPMWIEYPVRMGDNQEHSGRMGFMYGRVVDDDATSGTIRKPIYVVAIVGSNDQTGDLGPQGLLRLPEFPINNRDQGKLIWFQDKVETSKLRPEQIHMATQAFGEFLACLFLLQTPKIVETKLSSFGPRKAKVQQKTGKPFVELHRVTIRVGMSETRYQNVGGAKGTGIGGTKKYHRVMPHFRTYHRDTDKPKVKLVESFWRGDPKKGIVLHERSVKLGKDFTRREE